MVLAGVTGTSLHLYPHFLYYLLLLLSINYIIITVPILMTLVDEVHKIAVVCNIKCESYIIAGMSFVLLLGWPYVSTKIASNRE